MRNQPLKLALHTWLAAAGTFRTWTQAVQRQSWPRVGRTACNQTLTIAGKFAIMKLFFSLASASRVSGCQEVPKREASRL